MVVTDEFPFLNEQRDALRRDFHTKFSQAPSIGTLGRSNDNMYILKPTEHNRGRYILLIYKRIPDVKFNLCRIDVFGKLIIFFS